MKVEQIAPQEGKQTDLLQSEADIVIYGGAAGSGKTYGVLLEAGRGIGVENYGAVIFRKSITQIEKEGGLWDTAMKIYPRMFGKPNANSKLFKWDRFKSKISFAYLARDADLVDWQGTQIPLIIFDELTHFTKKMFFYMLSRNRSVCGVKPYMRATCNPDPDSWVRLFIDWWIGEDGYAIEERSGIVRWFVHQNDEIHWFDTQEDADKAFPPVAPMYASKAKSFTFIAANVFDNKILLRDDPDYLTNLEALPAVDRERLLKGNWNIRAGAGDYFSRATFEVVDALPKMKYIVRCWDLAATPVSETNPDPDWTVGMKAGIDSEGIIYIIDIKRVRMSAVKVKQLFMNTTKQDSVKVAVRIPQDAGSAGKAVAADYIKAVAGYNVKALPVSGSKEVRARPASAQAGIGNIKVARGDWNEEFFKELEGFPLAGHDDMVDTLSDCVEELTNVKKQVKVVNAPSVFRR